MLLLLLSADIFTNMRREGRRERMREGVQGVERQNVEETDEERYVGDAGHWENGARDCSRNLQKWRRNSGRKG